MTRLPGLQSDEAQALVPSDIIEETEEQLEMARELLPQLDVKSYLEGHMTPIFFGSALMSFGVEDLLNALVRLAPEPRSFKAHERTIEAGEQKVAGVVFKIQANMDPKHRDRIAFVRLTSGHFKRGMKLHHVRSGKPITVSAPMLFLAEDRTTADEAHAGDIIGIPNHGTLRIGDMLTEGEKLHAADIPSFAPEIMQVARVDDPMRAKHMGRALQQFAEEGAASVFRMELGGNHIVVLLACCSLTFCATDWSVNITYQCVLSLPRKP
jgi:Peptide chain release factor RF-3